MVSVHASHRKPPTLQTQSVLTERGGAARLGREHNASRWHRRNTDGRLVAPWPAVPSRAPLREPIIVRCQVERDRLAEALTVYADHRNWGITRDELRHPSAVWIGPRSTETVPDAPGVARAALEAKT
jgi:hypothetical protein